MSQQSQTSTATQLTLTAISTALVSVATMVFSIYVPKTEGFFNIGETMIYVTAMLFGPLTGAFAGGVGSMIADILLGYPHFAPATLAIKACEGGVVGILARKTPKFSSKALWRSFTFVVGLVSGALLGSIGSLYYSGDVELYLGIPPPSIPNLTFFVPSAFWYLLGALVVFLVTAAGFVLEPEFGWQIFAMFIGGSVMVSGYFLYEQFLLFPLFNVPAVAIAELPVNIGQMVVGMIISLPIVRIVRRSLPEIKG